MCKAGIRRENSSFFLTKPIKNDPKETFTHNSAPKNLEYESRESMTENSNVYKTIRKNTEVEYITKILFLY